MCLVRNKVYEHRQNCTNNLYGLVEERIPKKILQNKLKGHKDQRRTAGKFGIVLRICHEKFLSHAFQFH